MKVLVTGAAGFIGYHTALRLLQNGHEVIGYDNLCPYYPLWIKRKRLENLEKHDGFDFVFGDLCDSAKLDPIVKDCTHVIHLAAQAGVRHSLSHPFHYIRSNIEGFQVVIDLVKKYRSENFIYASSSSVYGDSKDYPFCESHRIEHPYNMYAISKLSNEFMAKAYSHHYDLPSTGLRFFTVYGPWGRPDMALYIFSSKLVRNLPIPYFNAGQMVRDFTYIDDIVNGIMLALAKPEKGQIYNLASGEPHRLDTLMEYLKKYLYIMRIKYERLPFQCGDVEKTAANIMKAKENLGYKPQWSLEKGVDEFTKWFKEVCIENLS